MTSAKPFYDAATYPAGESVGFLVRQLRMSFTHCIDRTMARYDLTDAQVDEVVAAVKAAVDEVMGPA